MSATVKPSHTDQPTDQVENSLALSGAAYRWRIVKGAGKFLLVRIASLAAAVVTAVYLTIFIVNLGGHLDTIVSANIRQNVGFMVAGGLFSDMAPEERLIQAEALIETLKDEAGLNDPLLLRTARWMGDGLTLNWGEPERNPGYGLRSANQSVREVVSDHLSRTLLVFGLANILMFVAALLIALALNRRFSGVLDRIFVLLSPLSSTPAWIFGILLSVILLRLFGFTPGGTFDSWPESIGLASIMVTLRAMLLPFIAIFLAGLFRTAFTWRSYFLSETNEAYVELAYAKGLKNRQIDRSYILRPALPALLTSFALLLAVLWQEVIALEYFFNVQGVGRLFVTALNAYDTAMIVAITTTFAYLLMLTVLLLDIVYVFVDPRVRLGSQNNAGNVVRSEVKPFWLRGRGTPSNAVASTRKPIRLPRIELAGITSWFEGFGAEIGQAVTELRRYPAAVLGLGIIIFLIGLSIYTVLAHPYRETVEMWRSTQGVWDRFPRDALPTWVNLFSQRDLPPTITFSSAAGGGNHQSEAISEQMIDETYTFAFDYDYGGFPQDIIVDINATYELKGPHITLTWIWPDGTTRELASYQASPKDVYFLSQDERLKRRLRTERPLEALFLDPEEEGGTEPRPGTYALQLNALHFEADSQLEAQVNLLGQVYGLAGTDSRRRDLMLALLWGTPVALTFGLAAALVTSIGGMTIAALAAWYGGWVDRGVQFLTEINLILPFFPVALMVFTLYSRSILTILGVVIALSLFGSSVKTYRAAFLQLRGSPYVEAARAYGASNWRIVSRYMLPRLITLLVPMMIILVPTYVFLEATLAYLGVSDPLLPTWGKLIAAAMSYSVLSNATHLVIAPFAMLFLTGFAFAMVGSALERILDPRLRES